MLQKNCQVKGRAAGFIGFENYAPLRTANLTWWKVLCILAILRPVLSGAIALGRWEGVRLSVIHYFDEYGNS